MSEISGKISKFMNYVQRSVIKQKHPLSEYKPAIGTYDVILILPSDINPPIEDLNEVLGAELHKQMEPYYDGWDCELSTRQMGHSNECTVAKSIEYHYYEVPPELAKQVEAYVSNDTRIKTRIYEITLDSDDDDFKYDSKPDSE
jgi:hypothetical protein